MRSVNAGQRRFKIAQQLIEGARSRYSLTADQDIIPSIKADIWQDRPGNLAQAALSPVASDGIANFLGAGIADPDP